MSVPFHKELWYSKPTDIIQRGSAVKFLPIEIISIGMQIINTTSEISNGTAVSNRFNNSVDDIINRDPDKNINATRWSTLLRWIVIESSCSQSREDSKTLTTEKIVKSGISVKGRDSDTTGNSRLDATPTIIAVTKLTPTE
jgi:hypothetical protein